MEHYLGRKTTIGARFSTSTVLVELHMQTAITTKMSTNPMTISLIDTGTILRCLRLGLRSLIVQRGL